MLMGDHLTHTLRMTRSFVRLPLVMIVVALGACQRQVPSPPRSGDSLTTRLQPRLSTGVRLDPAAPMADVGPMPLTMRLAPDGDRVALLLNGYREQGVQIVDAASGRVLQDLPQAAAFIGLAFAPDGSALYASGGNQDVVYRYAWSGGRATSRDSIVLAWQAPNAGGKRHPAGPALSPDGKTPYVPENL